VDGLGRVERSMTTEKLKKSFRYDLAESVEYVGRAETGYGAR
jgi:hypothetical protein